MADQTFYVRREEINETRLPEPSGEQPYSTDATFVIKGDKTKELQRGLVCGCYAGAYWSVTARTTGHSSVEIDGNFPVIAPPRFIATRTRKLKHWPGGERGPYAAEAARLIDLVWERIREGHGEDPRSGLLVIAGTTGSGKTTYARELALRAVAPWVSTAKKRDRPHVVTYEDPIESWFAYSPVAASLAGFEYTPREKGTDVGCLRNAVEDALRQKPALLYVGEVRSDDDWQVLLTFANTGHLAITTTHAGSLTKALERIFKAVVARTPADRSDVGRRIVAMLHTKNIAGKHVPSLWVQTPRSRTALTQEGLASLLPTGEADGRYGRLYFARKLRYGPLIQELALQSDLRGD